MAPLIGLYSPAPQSGKSTLALALGPLGYNRVRFAGPLKAMLSALLLNSGASFELTQRMLDGDLKEAPSTFLQGKTPREAMQTLGTEWGRTMLGEGLWVSAAIGDANELRRQGLGVVIDDVRFPNEAEAVSAAGGILVKVVRRGAVRCTEHASEGALEGWPFNMTLANDAPSAEEFVGDVAWRVDQFARAWRV